MKGSSKAPDEPAIDTALRSVGMTEIVIGSGSSFAASTGAACVYGTFTTAGPHFAIGPVDPGGSCLP